jgi:hypothetical protein
MYASRRWSAGSRPARRPGFTLVELTVVCAMVIAATAILGRLTVGLLDAHASGEARSTLIGMGRIAAERMTAELRLAKSFSRADETDVEFIADLGAGDTTIRYFLDDPGSDGLPPIYLSRSVGASTAQPLAILLDSVGGTIPPAPPATPRLELRYHDAAGTPLAPPLDAAERSAVRLVGVTVTLESGEDDGGHSLPHETAVFRWGAAPRNLRRPGTGRRRRRARDGNGSRTAHLPRCGEKGERP